MPCAAQTEGFVILLVGSPPRPFAIERGSNCSLPPSCFSLPPILTSNAHGG